MSRVATVTALNGLLDVRWGRKASLGKGQVVYSRRAERMSEAKREGPCTCDTRRRGAAPQTGDQNPQTGRSAWR